MIYDFDENHSLSKEGIFFNDFIRATVWVSFISNSLSEFGCWGKLEHVFSVRVRLLCFFFFLTWLKPKEMVAWTTTTFWIWFPGFLHYTQRVPLYFKVMTCLYSSLKVADQSRVGFVWTRDRTVGQWVPPHEVFFQWGNMALMSNIWFQTEIWGLPETKIWASQKSVKIQCVRSSLQGCCV